MKTRNINMNCGYKEKNIQAISDTGPHTTTTTARLRYYDNLQLKLDGVMLKNWNVNSGANKA